MAGPEVLTAVQALNLVMLLNAGATSRERAVNRFHPEMRLCSANVLAILQRYDLVRSRVTASSGGSKMMHYWLAPEGRDAAHHAAMKAAA
jgi:hypothetical protein